MKTPRLLKRIILTLSCGLLLSVILISCSKNEPYVSQRGEALFTLMDKVVWGMDEDQVTAVFENQYDGSCTLKTEQPDTLLCNGDATNAMQKNNSLTLYRMTFADGRRKNLRSVEVVGGSEKPADYAALINEITRAFSLKGEIGANQLSAANDDNRYLLQLNTQKGVFSLQFDPVLP